MVSLDDVEDYWHSIRDVLQASDVEKPSEQDSVDHILKEMPALLSAMRKDVARLDELMLKLRDVE